MIDLTMSLFVITCRRSNRWVFNGVKLSRTTFRWLRLFVLLRLFELKTDAEEVFLIKMFFFHKKKIRESETYIFWLLLMSKGGREFNVIGPLDSLGCCRVDDKDEVSKYPLSLLNDLQTNKIFLRNSQFSTYIWTVSRWIHRTFQEKRMIPNLY